MKQCVVCQYVDYSDYQPMSVPLKNAIDSQSAEYTEYMKSIDSDNWQSPISYLKKRGYMPATDDENSGEVHTREHDEHKRNQLNDKSNLISQEDESRCLEKNCLGATEIDQPEGGAAASKEKSEPQGNEPKSEKTGIITKVKNKFLSLFSSRSSNQSDESHITEKSDFLDREHYELDELDGHDLPEREMLPRNADKKPAKVPKTNQDDAPRNLSENDIKYVKNFIKCFKESWKESERKQMNASGTSTRPNSGNSKGNISATESFKKLSSVTENCDEQTTPKSIIHNSTTFVDGYEGLSTPKTTGLEANDEADEITVDLDISQQNGTGQVILSDSKTTECAPLRLKDMSFDLEWNKNNEVGRDEMNDIDGSFQRNPQDQSLAAKFLKDVSSYTQRKEDHLRTTYSDNFLDSQQKSPDESAKSVRVSSKREVPDKSIHPFATASLQNSAIDDEYNYETYEKVVPKRRTRVRGKNRSRKRPKLKSKKRPTLYESDVESVGGQEYVEAKSNYHPCGELNNINVRLRPDDEEASSKFIANLNSPPELFSFDVNQYLRSSDVENNPQTYTFQAPEARTYYDIEDVPAVENELIENPSLEDDEQQYSSGDKKRELLRQHTKGVSNALLQKYPGNRGQFVTADDDDSSQTGSFVNTNLAAGKGYIPCVDSNLEYAEPSRSDEFLGDYYLQNDGSAQESEVDAVDGENSPNTEVDKFRDMGFSSLEGEMKQVAPRLEGNVAEIDRNVEEKDPASSDENY